MNLRLKKVKNKAYTYGVSFILVIDIVNIIYQVIDNQY